MNLYNDKIKFMHFRRFTDAFTPKGKDGMTVAYYQEGNRFTFAMTRCGKSNNFNKKEGRKWSVARLKEREFRNVMDFPSAKEFRQYIEEYVKRNTRFSRQEWWRSAPRGPVITEVVPTRGVRNTETPFTKVFSPPENCS